MKIRSVNGPVRIYSQFRKIRTGQKSVPKIRTGLKSVPRTKLCTDNPYQKSVPRTSRTKNPYHGPDRTFYGPAVRTTLVQTVWSDPKYEFRNFILGTTQLLQLLPLKPKVHFFVIETQFRRVLTQKSWWTACNWVNTNTICCFHHFCCCWFDNCWMAHLDWQLNGLHIMSSVSNFWQIDGSMSSTGF